MTLSIRRAMPSDLPAIDTLIARSYARLLKADYPPSTLVLALPIIARAQAALMRTPTYFVAEDHEGRIVGVGGWTPRDPHTGRTRRGEGHIRAFATDPDATRKGVGSAVMQAVLDSARVAGVTRLGALATRTAVPFYLRHGFRRGPEIGIALRPGITFASVAMRRG